MALVVKDRVKETTATTGTGTVTLGGAATGYQAFSAIGDGNTTYYAITDTATGDWEVGLGTYTASGTTLSRDTILESSNSGSAVNLSAGTKLVFCTYPAEKSAFTDDIPTNNNELTNGAGYITGNQTITLSGDVSGSGTTSISVTVADDSHNHVISNVDGLQTALDGKVDDSQVLTNVPSGAVFTDTTYSVGDGGLTEINFTSALNTKLSGIESGATADQTASEILTLIKTVDGSGSGLDADTLDGVSSGSFLRSDTNGTLTGYIAVGGSNRDGGMIGTYDSYKTQQIWAMGSSYRSNAAGTNFGSLYGAAYKHTNNATGGTMAGGHQMVWCQNGTGTAAIGSNIWTSGDVTAYSDIRVKTNLERIPDALEKVQKLNGYTFDRTDVKYDDEGNPTVPARQTGVVAQEVLEVLPEAVRGSEEEHYSVSYGNMVGLLIEAIKDLKAEIDELKAK